MELREMLDGLFFWQTRVSPVRDIDDAPSESSVGTTDNEIELVGDQLENMADDTIKLQWWDLWALGMSTAIGGHFFIWNVGYIAGFGSYVISYFLIASAYGMLALCMAEMSGALPFAGGAYGISRVTLGTLPGFLIGCFDSYQSMFNVIYNSLAMAIIITFAAETDKKWEPLWWFLIYVSYMIIHIIGGVWMWRVLKVLSAGSVCLLLIYIFGSIKFANFEENAPLWYPFGLTGEQPWFQGGIRLFLKTIPFPCWFFIGTESINLAAHDCANPKRDVPRAYLLTYATILCTSCAMFFTVASVYPGPTGAARFLFPATFGYQLMFNCNMQKAVAIAFPAIYTSGFGFTYYYGSQIRAMGKAGLANTWMGYDIPHFKTPGPALLFGMVIGMLVGLRYYFFKILPHEDLLSINLLGAAAVYCSQFVSFIVFRLYYPTIKREFVSPLGIAGAVYGLLVFLLMFIVISGFEKQPAIEIFLVYVGVLVLYYFLVVQKRQVFSEEEKTVLFKAYLIKSNRSKNRRIRTGHTRPVAGASTPDDRDDAAMPSRMSRVKPTPNNSTYAGSTVASASGYNIGSRSDSDSRTGEKYALRSESDENSMSFHTQNVGVGSLMDAGKANHSGTLRLSAGYIELSTVPPIPEEDGATPLEHPAAGGSGGSGGSYGYDATRTSLLATGELGYRGYGQGNNHHHHTTSATAAATTATDGAAGGEIDMSQYMAPHSALADVLMEPNPNVY